MTVRLHINIDHVATLRQARGTHYPDPVEAAQVCEAAGADGITVHLREDRRHIQDHDVITLRRTVKTVLNLEMGATEEMLAIALSIKPDVVTLVPEKREERTTEGGRDVKGQLPVITRMVGTLRSAGMRVNLFIDPRASQVEASVRSAANGVELHTGDYAHAAGGMVSAELKRLEDAGKAALSARLDLAAGHGLSVANTPALVTAMPGVEELNIGHAVVADAVFVGLPEAVRRFREAIALGERGR